MKVLLFNCSKEIIKLLEELNIDYKCIEPSYQNNSIKSLLSDENLRTNQVLNFKESLMIFSEFNDENLDNVLSMMKIENIKVDLKCIVTDHNINWKVIKLYEELLKEKKAMQKYA